ncbi:MAG: peptide chain release factor N(5)-glutamine methyltransferase [Candidatus Gastranaerophilales bacterium]|nr:peptide chain release factor N(5)-glutamine methyltransferase [Candidatus Gastranaerophilales bacterium]
MYRKYFIDIYLANEFSFEEAKTEVNFVIETLFNYTYKDFILDKILEPWQLIKIEKVIKERVKTHRPIQQIIGQAYFYGRKFFVNQFTLIPRPETEILVSEVLALCQNFQNPKILDIGSGTGCIPITLILENSDITAHSIDISQEALEISKKNALFHNVLNNISFFKSNLFENVNEKYNIIVSNLPYIPLKDKENLQIEVRDFEPQSALYTNDEYGIEFYEKIIKQAGNYLINDGYLAFEFGLNQFDMIFKLLKNYGFSSIEKIKDFNGIERVTICKK